MFSIFKHEPIMPILDFKMAKKPLCTERHAVVDLRAVHALTLCVSDEPVVNFTQREQGFCRSCTSAKHAMLEETPTIFTAFYLFTIVLKRQVTLRFTKIQLHHCHEVKSILTINFTTMINSSSKSI